MWKVLVQVLPLPSPPPTPFTIGVPACTLSEGALHASGPPMESCGPQEHITLPSPSGNAHCSLPPAPSPLRSELAQVGSGAGAPSHLRIISYLHVLGPPASELVLGTVCGGTLPFHRAPSGPGSPGKSRTHQGSVGRPGVRPWDADGFPNASLLWALRLPHGAAGVRKEARPHFRGCLSGASTVQGSPALRTQVVQQLRLLNPLDGHRLPRVARSSRCTGARLQQPNI